MNFKAIMILLTGAAFAGCAGSTGHGHNESLPHGMASAQAAASRPSSAEAQQLLALQQERVQLLATLGDFHERVRDLESKLADREGKPIAKSYDELLAVKEAELGELRKIALESGAVVAQRDALSAELAQAKQRLTALEQQVAKKEQEVASLRGLAAAAAEMESAKRRAAELEAQLAQRDSETRTLRSAAAERESLATQLHTATVALNHAKERMTAIEKQLAQKELDLRAQVAEKQRLSTESANYAAELKQSRHRIAALEQQGLEREQQLQMLKRTGNDRDRLASQLASMNTDLAQTKQQASLLERQLAAKGREVETLRVLVAEQEKLLHQPASHKESTGQRASIKPPAPGASQPAVSNQPAGPKSESTTGTAPPTHKPTPLRGSDQLAKLDQTREELVRAFQDDMTKGSMSIQQAGNQLSLSLSSALLFPPGEVTLKPDGMVMLKRIGQVLAQGSDRAIQVTGHTDNQAISKQLKRTFPDNRAWSWARADSARRALISGGTPPDRIRAVGLADTKPLASNTTEAGRQKNRRIEIIVTQFSIPSRTVTSGQGRNGTRMTALSVPDEQDAR